MVRDDSEFISSDEEIMEHQVGSRKRRKLTPSAEDSDQSSENQDAKSASTLPVSTISRIKARSQTAQEATRAAVPVQSLGAPTKEKLSFASIDVAPWLVASLSSMEIKKPTGIQAACIPEILKGRDCI